jgi:hypothetical protein
MEERLCTSSSVSFSWKAMRQGELQGFFERHVSWTFGWQSSRPALRVTLMFKTKAPEAENDPE